MSLSVRVAYLGVQRQITSKKDGSLHVFSELWVTVPGVPFPQKIDHYGPVGFAAGDYQVPVHLSVRNDRLELQLVVENARPLKES